MNKWEAMLAEGIDLSRVNASQKKEFEKQIMLPFEPEIKMPPKNWMTQDELNMRSKRVMEFLKPKI